MARQSLIKSTATVGGFPTAGVTVTFTAENVTDHSSFVNTGKELVLVWNTHGSTTYTFTVTGVTDKFGRSGNITAENITAGAIKCLGPFSAQEPGWMQTDGTIQLDANNASVKFAVITLP